MALSVNNVSVNEASPYLIFSVSADPGQRLDLLLSGSGAPGEATVNTDTGSLLEYYDITTGTWKPITYPLTVPTLGVPSVPAGQTEAFYQSRLIVANFHGAFYRAADGGWFVGGDNAAPSGTSANTTPLLVTPANGYNYTGTLIDVAAGGQNQYAIATTDGIWVWGTEDELAHTTLTTSAAFQKLTLPAGMNPAQIKFLSASDSGMAVVMSDGTVWVGVSGRGTGYAQGNGATTSITPTFVKVLTAANTPLTGITQLEYLAAGGFAYNETTKKFYTWGTNSYKGDNTAAANHAYATEMTAPALPAGVSVVQVAMTGNYRGSSASRTLYVLGSNGRIYVLGKNSDGEAGQGNNLELKTWTTVKNSAGTAPLENVAFISAANSSPAQTYAGVIAVLKDGSVLTWGNDYLAFLGQPGTAGSNLPKAPTWLDAGGARPVSSAELGGHISFLNVTGEEGKITASGHNTGATFGDGTTADKAGYVTTSFTGTGNGGLKLYPSPTPGLQVRVAINQDTTFEVGETVTLRATINGTSTTATGTGTIYDDGTGQIFASTSTASGVDSKGFAVLNSTATLDNDTPLSVNNVTVNEASPYAVFKVSTVEGAALQLLLSNGSDPSTAAKQGADLASSLQVYLNNQWVA